MYTTIKIKVEGKNIYRFIRKLIDNKISIIRLDLIDRESINILVYKKDLKKIESIKTIYSMTIMDYLGIEKINRTIKKNKYLIIFLVIGFILLKILTNIIFKIEIIHNDKQIRNIVLEELNKSGLKKYSFKKNYDEIQDIKKKILNKHKDKIEWLEIENIGTKYTVRLEERIIDEKVKEYKKQHVIASTEAIILNIEAKNGVIVKNINDYVKKGDIIISGNITLNDEVKNSIAAIGTVYGEVWYKVDIEYPMHYVEKIETLKSKNVYVLKFLNFSFELFNFKKYKYKNIKEKNIAVSSFLPIGLYKQHQDELKVIDEKLSKEETIKKAIDLATKKIEEKLIEKEKIIDVKKLHVETKNSTIVLELFFTVYKDITDYLEIVDE